MGTPAGHGAPGRCGKSRMVWLSSEKDHRFINTIAAGSAPGGGRFSHEPPNISQESVCKTPVGRGCNPWESGFSHEPPDGDRAFGGPGGRDGGLVWGETRPSAQASDSEVNDLLTITRRAVGSPPRPARGRRQRLNGGDGKA